MYQITEHEIDALNVSGGYKTLDVALFSLCFGVFFAVVITLTTVSITDPVIFSSYVAAGVLFFIASLFFGIRSLLAWKAMKDQIRRIKS